MKKLIIKPMLAALTIGLLFGCGNAEKKAKENAVIEAEASRLADSISSALVVALGEASEEDSKAIFCKDAKPDLTKLRVEKDEFKEVSFYEHPKRPKGYVKDVMPYIVESAKNSELRFLMRLIIKYSADDWLFMNKAEFLCDGKKFTIWLDESVRDNDGGSIYETCDIPVTTHVKEVLKAIIEAKQTKMRYVGSEYYSDRTLKAAEVARIKDVYKALFDL